MAPDTGASQLSARVESPAESRGALLDRVAVAWQARLRAAMAELGLTPAQYRLLVAVAWLSSRQADVRQSEVAEQAGTDPVMTSEVLRTLETRGLVVRGPHATDRRARSIRPTIAGAELADKAVQLGDAVETSVLRGGNGSLRTAREGTQEGRTRPARSRRQLKHECAVTGSTGARC